MSSFKALLDIVSQEVSQEYPEKSEAEVVLITTRLNLTALAETLLTWIQMGEGLTVEGLCGVTEGIVDTCDWLVAKELLWQGIDAVERAANEG